MPGAKALSSRTAGEQHEVAVSADMTVSELLVRVLLKPLSKRCKLQAGIPHTREGSGDASNSPLCACAALGSGCGACCGP